MLSTACTCVGLALLIAAVSPSSTAMNLARCSNWCAYNNMLCISETLVLDTWTAAGNFQDCLIRLAILRPILEDLLVQWNQRTGICSAFNYQRVCRLVARHEGGTQDRCLLYRTKTLINCSVELSSRLSALWLPARAGNSSFSGNLACQGDPDAYKLLESNLTNTNDGVRFNGVSSYALLNSSGAALWGANRTFTWLMRLKRLPQAQPFIDSAPCNDSSKFGPHLWEHPEATRLFFGTPEDFYPVTRISSDVGLLPNNTNEWSDVGAVYNPSNGTYHLFFNSSFYGTPIYFAILPPNNYTCYFLKIGYRTPPNFLNGTVSAVAISTEALAEAEIRQIFASIP